MEKTQADNIISQSRCAMCGQGVHIDAKHGRITCNACNLATEYCTCEVIRPGSRF